jgi:predicted DNA-binding protein
MQLERHVELSPEWDIERDVAFGLQKCSAGTGNRYMSEQSPNGRRRAGRPPAGAREGEKVRDYPQLSIRIPHEQKARLIAMSAITGRAQWRVIVDAIECFYADLPETDQATINGLSKRLLRAG